VVGCATNFDCVNATAPICNTTISQCRPCQDAGALANAECGNSGDGNKGFCDPRGSGACVECLKQEDCQLVLDAPKVPYCNNETLACLPCKAAPQGGDAFCESIDPGNPFCQALDSNIANNGSCVQCLSTLNCTETGAGDTCNLADNTCA